jgi:hypothetical protein
MPGFLRLRSPHAEGNHSGITFIRLPSMDKPENGPAPCVSPSSVRTSTVDDPVKVSLDQVQATWDHSVESSSCRTLR